MNITTRFAVWLHEFKARIQPNTRLFKLIRKAEYRLGTALSLEDIRSIVELFRELESPITFRYLTVFLSVGLASIVWIILIAVNMADAHGWVGQKLPSPYFVLQDAILVCVTVSAASVVFRLRSHRRAFDALSSDLHRRYAYLLHGIKTAPVKDDLAGLAKHFAEFRRGDTGRVLSNKVVGSYQGDTHKLSFTYYRFRFVKCTSDGENTSKQEYERFALINEFPPVGNVLIRGDHRAQPKVIVITLFGDDSGIEREPKKQVPERYTSSSSAFNKRFNIFGSTKIDCARLLKPITTLTLLEHTDSLKNLNMQFADERLCMSFDNKDMLNFTTYTTLYNPEAMLEEMQGGIDNYRIPLLEYYLKLNHKLACQHDDNFSLPSEKPA